LGIYRDPKKKTAINNNFKVQKSSFAYLAISPLANIHNIKIA
jgi:hypothetical protein